MRTFREWFLDISDDAQQAAGKDTNRWQPTMSFRETPELGYYLPPLPRALQADSAIEQPASFNPSLGRSRSGRALFSSRQRIDSGVLWGDDAHTPSTPPDGGAGVLPPLSLEAPPPSQPTAHSAHPTHLRWGDAVDLTAAPHTRPA